MEEISEAEKVSIARACKIIDLDRSMFYYVSVKDDSQVISKLQWYAENLPRRGLPEYHKRMQKEGLPWSRNKVRRVYRLLGLNRRRKMKRRIPNPEKRALLQPLFPNLTWSMDFMEDRLDNGRKVRVLNIIDDYNREALAIEIAHSFPSERVVDIVSQQIEWRGKPEEIRTDNGTEFIAKAFEGFCSNSGITHVKTQKGKPNQNAFIERFNRSYREDILDANIFESLSQIKEMSLEWMYDYNNNHPHGSLDDHSPIEFMKKRMNL